MRSLGALLEEFVQVDMQRWSPIEKQVVVAPLEAALDTPYTHVACCYMIDVMIAGVLFAMVAAVRIPS